MFSHRSLHAHQAVGGGRSSQSATLLTLTNTDIPYDNTQSNSYTKLYASNKRAVGGLDVHVCIAEDRLGAELANLHVANVHRDGGGATNPHDSAARDAQLWAGRSSVRVARALDDDIDTLAVGVCVDLVTHRVGGLGVDLDTCSPQRKKTRRKFVR
jgi:hypothetical protein